MKRTKFALTALISLYGINKVTAQKLVGHFGLHPQTHDSNLLIRKHREFVLATLAKCRIQFRLKLIVFSRILTQIILKTYRGIRISQGLPISGRTHANAGTPHRLHATRKFIPFYAKKRHIAQKIGKNDKSKLSAARQKKTAARVKNNPEKKKDGKTKKR